MLRGSTEYRATSDREGQFRFDNLGLGLFRFYVDASTVPAEYLPIWKQHVSKVYTGEATGFGRTILRIEKDGDYEVDLILSRSSTVSGFLVDADGQPIEDAIIALASLDEHHSAGRTDSAGKYRIERVYPGSHSVTAKLSRSFKDADANAPLPMEVEIDVGSDVRLPDLIAGRSGHVLYGRVIDQDGEPMRGLNVQCTESGDVLHPLQIETVTDLHGRFRLGRVPSSQFTLDIVSQLSAGTAPQQNQTLLGEPIVASTIGALAEVNLGEIRVRNNHEFALNLIVNVDSKWAQSQGIVLRDIGVRIHDLPGSLRAMPLSPNQNEGSTYALRDATNLQVGYIWICPTPYPVSEVVVYIGEQEMKRVTVNPVPDDQATLTVSIP